MKEVNPIMFLSRYISKREGFTLIELLIVVAIIGIIAAIAIPNLLDAMDRSRQKASMAELRSGIGTALEEYKIDNSGRAPSSANFAALVTDLETEGYLDDPPTTDAWDNAYVYAVDANQRSYTASSSGKDGAGGAWAGGVMSEGSRDWDCDIFFANNHGNA